MSRRFEEAASDYGACNRIVASTVAGRARAWLSMAACVPNEGRRLGAFDDLVVGIVDTNRPFVMERDRGEGRERLRIVPGTVYAIPWDCERYVSWTGTYRFPSVAIPRGWVREFIEEAGVGDESAVVASAHLAVEDPVVAVLVRRLVDGYINARVQDAIDDLYCDQSIGLIVAALLRTGGRRDVAEGARAMPWRVRRAIDLVETREGGRVTLDDMALAAGLSRHHFTRVFKATTGRTPAEWVLARRLAGAREQLLTTRLPVAEIAKAAGFGSPSRFGAVFRERFGMTPTAWREAGR